MSKKIKMRNILVLIMVFSAFLSAYGQEEKSYNINFLHQPWNEVLEIAEKENKLVFVDCYTSWCGPCKMLSKKIFTQKEVADFYNTNFVCVKYDMEKGEGLKLKDRFDIKAFPTLIIFDKNGNEMHRKMGAGDAANIIKFGQEAIDGKGTGSMTIKFKNGERSPEFIEKYLNILEQFRMTKEGDFAVRQLLREQDKSEWNSAENWALIKAHLQNINSPEEAYIRENRNDFIEVVGKDEFNSTFKKMYNRHAQPILIKKGEEHFEIDEEAYAKFETMLTERDVPGRKEILLELRITASLFSLKWDEAVKHIAISINYNYEPQDILKWVSFLERKCTNSEYRQKAVEWVKYASQLSDKKDIQGWSNHLLEKL